MPSESEEQKTRFSGEEDTLAFSLEEHKTRTTQVWADFEKYRNVLNELTRRVELLENIHKEDTDG